MSRNEDLFADLVEGQSYRIGTSSEYPGGSGGVRWDLSLYQQPDPEMPRIPGTTGPVWLQIRTCVKPEPTDYREAALEWLRELGYDPDMMDVGLFLMPRAAERQVVERLRPMSKGGS